MRECEVCGGAADLTAFFGPTVCLSCHSGLIQFYLRKMVEDGILSPTGEKSENGADLYAFSEELQKGRRGRTLSQFAEVIFADSTVMRKIKPIP